jgi:hypothetical protein
MFFPDLDSECQVDRGDHVRAVGWLSEEHPFPTGSVPLGFSAALRTLIKSAWQPVTAMGPQFCEFCAKTDRVGGSKNVWIPTPEKVYIAPELIAHYIETHSYRPPDEFIEAVLACPPQGSDEFQAALHRFPCWWAPHTIR